MAFDMNRVIFGEPISEEVQDRLRARQELATKPDVGESVISKINSDFIEGQGAGQKAFADMSSRVPFARMWTAVKAIQSTPDGGDSPTLYDTRELAAAKIKQSDSGQFLKKDGNKYKVFNVESVSDTKVYQIGSHVLSRTSTVPTDSKTLGTTDIQQTDVFPSEFQSNQNEFFAPQAGITSVSSETMGLGFMKKTTVNFTVHNFHDFDKIFSRYFLRPGAGMFVDFGWSTSELYDPNTILEQNTLKGVRKKLYDGKGGIVTKMKGDLEVIYGSVVNYDSKVTSTGAFECSVELLSQNAALLALEIDDDMKTKLKKGLDISVLNYLYTAVLPENIFPYLPRKASFTAKTLAEYEDQLGAEIANASGPGSSHVLSDDSVFYGVYYAEDGDEKALFVSYGFFEDELLNGEFALGDKKSYRVGSKPGEPMYDSRNSYTVYSKDLYDRQIMSRSIKRRKFLYPENWDNSYNSKNSVGTPTQSDKDSGKIPLRELFISVDMIKRAIDKNDNVQNLLKTIMKDLKEDSAELIDLRISSGDAVGGNLSVNDVNVMPGFITDDEKDTHDTLFTFRPLSPNSIIKEYNLNFKLPSGDMGNAFMAEALSPSETMFPVSSMLDTAMANKVVLNETSNLSNIGIEYQPPTGRYSLEKYKKTVNEKDVAIIEFGTAERNVTLVSDKSLNTYLDSAQGGAADKGEKREVKVKTDPQLSSDSLRVTNSIDKYYTARAGRAYLSEQKATPLWIELSLALYGTSGILPGNLFRVDYLPSFHINKIMFRTTKISHQIDSTWTTTIDSQMVLRPQKKIKDSMYNTDIDIILSRSTLKNEPFKLADVENLLPYINNLKPINVNKHFKHITGVFTFDAAADGDGIEGAYSKITSTEEGEETKVTKYIGYSDVISANFVKTDLTEGTKYWLITQGKWWIIVDKSRETRIKDQYDVDVSEPLIVDSGGGGAG